jgi:hypothetical protein
MGGFGVVKKTFPFHPKKEERGKVTLQVVVVLLGVVFIRIELVFHLFLVEVDP